LLRYSAAPQEEKEGDDNCRHLLLLHCSTSKQEEEEGDVSICTFFFAPSCVAQKRIRRR
jgi:hypothetical protein